MQAARGTSVTAHDPRRRRLLLLFALVAVLAYTVDQVTKILAVEKLEDQPNVQVVGDLLQLHFTRNPGAAFSMGTELTPWLSAVAVVAACAVIWFVRRVGSTGWACALGFLLAGITGNLTDRILRAPSVLHGHVVDFLELPNWPIFNVADICINIAAGLIVILALRGIRLDGSRDQRTTDSDSDSAPDTAPDTEADATTASQVDAE